MGLFFEDTKPPEPPPVVPEPKQDWLTALIAGTFVIIGITLIHVLKAIAFVAKPTFAYLFIFEGRTNQQIGQQMTIAAAIILLPIFLLYKIPFVRDGLSLKTTHTLNHSVDGQRIQFPDRAFFTLTERRLGHAYGSKVYLTYAGHTENVTQKMSSGQCQGVTREHVIELSSENEPTHAEGFEDAVTYVVEQSASDLKGVRRIWHMFTHPNLWFASNITLMTTKIRYEVTTPWKEFIDNWDDIRPPPELNDWKTFKVEALATEHAMVCF